MEIRIRKAEKRDAGALARLLKQVGAVHGEGRPDIYERRPSKYDEKAALELVGSGVGILVAEEGGEIRGELIYKIMNREGDGFYRPRKWLYIDDLCVDEGARGRGIAHALEAEAERIAAAEGCDAVELNCWAVNTRATAFYESAGFTRQKSQYEKILKK